MHFVGSQKADTLNMALSRLTHLKVPATQLFSSTSSIRLVLRSLPLWLTGRKTPTYWLTYSPSLCVTVSLSAPPSIPTPTSPPHLCLSRPLSYTSIMYWLTFAQHFYLNVMFASGAKKLQVNAGTCIRTACRDEWMSADQYMPQPFYVLFRLFLLFWTND